MTLIEAADRMLRLANLKLKAAQRVWEWSGHGVDRVIARKAQILNNRSMQMNRDSRLLRRWAEVGQ